MTQTMLNSLMLMGLSTAFGVVTTAFWRSRQAVVEKAKALADENAKMVHRVNDLETKLAVVNQAVIPISTAFQAILIKELTHFHTPDMDALMQKIGPPNTLTAEEQERLAVLLKERMLDMGPEISDAERDAAMILPAIIKRAKVEAETLSSAEAMKVKLVTVAAVVGVANRNGEHTEPMLAAVIDDRRVVAGGVPTADVLQHIEKNTAKTAEALSVINRNATDKLAKTTKDKAEKAKDES